jgi:photosystem II stability/assembly factor-like uncharacterized protein
VYVPAGDGKGTLWASEGAFLVTSKDGGLTWRAVSDTGLGGDFVVLPVAGGLIARKQHGADVVVSRDGKKWAAPRWPAREALSSSFVDPKKAVAVAAPTLVVDAHDRKLVYAVSADGCGLLRSSDGGAKFKETFGQARTRIPKSDVPESWLCPEELRLGAIAPDAKEKGVVWAAGRPGVLRSSDGGKRWKKVADAPDQHEIVSAAATGGLLFVSTAEGATYGTELDSERAKKRP